MLTDWSWILVLGTMFITVQSLPTGIGEDTKKNEQILRPKGKYLVWHNSMYNFIYTEVNNTYT
jgi:hypothetical protein